MDCGGNVVYNCARPNQVANPNGEPVSRALFSTLRFRIKYITGTLGTEGRNAVLGPGYQQWDLWIHKDFPSARTSTSSFGSEFNIANHVDLLTGRQGQDG